MKKSLCFWENLLVIVFFVFIVSIGTTILFSPPKSFSEKENRALATRPDTSVKSIISGSFFSELRSFYNDQLPLRDGFTAIYSLFELGLGKREINGVLYANDSTLISLPKYENTNKIQNNLNAIYSIAEKEDVCFYLPPRSFDVFRDKLPTFYPNENADSVIKLLRDETKKEISDLIQSDEEYLYYKTDHHWTTHGAYQAYRQICKKMELTPYEKEYFNEVCVSEYFFGSTSSKSGLPNQALTADSITLYRYAEDEDIIIENHENNSIQNSFYDFNALNDKDKYRVFLGGNFSHLTVKSSNTTKKEKLLLIKDSFANSLIPFLALHFDIEVIDPRYCSKNYLKEQLERSDINQTLIVMGFDSLTTNIFN